MAGKKKQSANFEVRLKGLNSYSDGGKITFKKGRAYQVDAKKAAKLKETGYFNVKELVAAGEGE